MVKKKSWVTAEELAAELEQDTEFLQRKAEQELRRRQLEARNRELVAPILAELDRNDVKALTIEDLTRRYAPLSEEIVQVLLKWLPRVEDEKAKEQLIRAVASAREPFDGRPLMNLFDSTESEVLQWTIANTVAEARPSGIEDRVIEAAMNPASGRAREMLALAVARLIPRERAKPVLTALFEEFPGHVAMSWAEIGGTEELAILEGKRENTRGWVKKEMERAIESIRNRGVL
jgi:hypothetical protein